MNNVLFSILASEKSKFNVTFDSAQNNAIQSAMNIYAGRVLNDYREAESKRVKLEALKLFPALWMGELKLWLRQKSFESAKRQAQKIADTDGYKTYVIRSSEINYKLMTTLDVELNKTFRIFKKDVNAITLEKTASFTATRKVHPPVVKRR